MGVVYRVNLSDGRFYIGCTSNDLSSRIGSHFRSNESYLGDAYRELNYSLKDALKSSKIIYEGYFCKDVEKCEIYNYRDNDLMINKKIYRPRLEYWILYTHGLVGFLDALKSSGGLKKYYKNTRFADKKLEVKK